MSTCKCEKWFHEHHRMILWLLFFVSIYYVCILKLRSNIDTNEPETFLAFFGKKDTRPQLVESNSPQHGSFNRIYEALRLIPAFRRPKEIRREKIFVESAIESNQYVGKPDSIGHGSTTIFSRGRRRGLGFDSNAFDKFIQFLTPIPVPCRSIVPYIVKKNSPFDATDSRNIRDHDCFDQTECEMLANAADKRCQVFHSPAETAHFSSRKISSRILSSSVLSRLMPKRVSNILLDKLEPSAKISVRNIDLHIDESLSFMNKIRELQAALDREMELNLHLNFSGLNTLRKHGIIKQFLQSAVRALHPRVLVRSSLPPAALRRLLYTEAVGSSAAVTLKTNWENQGPNIENESEKNHYFNNVHK